MPPVQAFIQQQAYLEQPQQIAVAQPVGAYLPPPPQIQVAQPVSPSYFHTHTYQPQPQYESVQQPYPQVQVIAAQPLPQRVISYQPAPITTVQVIAQPVKTSYLPPPRAYLPPASAPKVVYQQPAVIAVEKPSLSFSLPKKQVVSIVQEDSYSVPPTQTVTDLGGPVYPESIRVVDKVKSTYGPPNFTPGTPLGPSTTVIEQAPPAVIAVKKPVKVGKSVILLCNPLVGQRSSKFDLSVTSDISRIDSFHS
jgi:hypothetical protein